MDDVTAVIEQATDAAMGTPMHRMPDRSASTGIVCRSAAGVNDFSKRLRQRISFLESKGPILQ